MGGGQGGWSLDKDMIKKLEKIAKENLKKDIQTKRHVFISFANEDIDNVNLFRGQAKNDNSDLEFNDYSLKKPFNSEDAEYIKRGIRERIRQSSVTIVYLSEYSVKSEWVRWEIAESLKLGKPIIGVHSGAQPSIIPDGLACSDVIPWRHRDLMDAIEKKCRSK